MDSPPSDANAPLPLPPPVPSRTVSRLSRVLRRARVIESAAWAGVWFCAGAGAAVSARGEIPIVWLGLGLAAWLTSVSYGRKKARVVRGLLQAEGHAPEERASLRAREALGGLGDALSLLGEWASDTRAWVERETVPPPVDPSVPIPPNPLPKQASLTNPPPAMRARIATGTVVELPRLEEPPPSHPSLSREPDHDPKTCKVCQNTSEPPPFGPGSLRSLPPYSESFVPASPLPSASPPSPRPVSESDADVEVGRAHEMGDSEPFIRTAE